MDPSQVQWTPSSNGDKSCSLDIIAHEGGKFTLRSKDGSYEQSFDSQNEVTSAFQQIAESAHQAS